MNTIEVESERKKRPMVWPIIRFLWVSFSAVATIMLAFDRMWGWAIVTALFAIVPTLLIFRHIWKKEHAAPSDTPPRA